MASINARRGKLVVDFRYLGIRCREQTILDDTAGNRRKLKKLMEQLEAEMKLGTFEYAKYFPKSPRAEQMSNRKEGIQTLQSGMPRFEEFKSTWFAEHKIEWRESYQEKIKIVLDKYLTPFFGNRPVDRIKKSDLLDFRASLAKVNNPKRPAGLTAARINQIMTPLRMILDEAAERYEFDTPYKNIKTLRETKPDVMPFNMEEVWLIINNVRKDFRNYYLVRFFTGLRTSEIDGLKWRNVDLERREINVREALVNGQTGGTKTRGSERVVQMSQLVHDALAAQKQITAKKSEYVFCNRLGEPLEYRNVNRRVWHPTLFLLGLERRRAYQTRHTAATLWLASGENPEWIARQLGHSTTEMLFRVYSRYVPDVTRKDGSAFEQLLLASMAVTEESEL